MAPNARKTGKPVLVVLFLDLFTLGTGLGGRDRLVVVLGILLEGFADEAGGKQHQPCAGG
jgi:hypothetical protein